MSTTVLEELYDTATPPPAASGTGGSDVFIAVSPVGYGYVLKFSQSMREANAAQQGRRMAALDMNILNLIDYKPTDYKPSSTPTGKRPTPPCPAGWWTPKPGVCAQGCPSAKQTRDPKTGRCYCGAASGPKKVKMLISIELFGFCTKDVRFCIENVGFCRVCACRAPCARAISARIADLVPMPAAPLATRALRKCTGRTCASQRSTRCSCTPGTPATKETALIPGTAIAIEMPTCFGTFY